MTEKEKSYLRDLAKKYREVSESDANQKKREKWYQINDLGDASQPVFMNHFWTTSINELYPPESFFCQDPTARKFELYLRDKLFCSQELNDDNVLEPVIYAEHVFDMQDYEGLEFETRRSEHDTSGTSAYEMIPVLHGEEDIEKLRPPKFHYDKEASRRKFEEAQEIFSPILTVIKTPYAPAMKITDEYSWMRGMQNTYTDMYDEPEMMHAMLRKITDNIAQRFRLLEESGVWGMLDQSFPLGSAGLRFTRELPDFRSVSDHFEYKTKLKDSWGFTCAEVCTCVSNAMTREFSYEYDKELMQLFHFMNVGCCEVLDHKIDLVSKLPNVRKIGVAEWCDPELAAEQIKGDFVYSYHAAGVPFVCDQWDRASAEKEIKSVLKAVGKHGCHTEIVLNIGGTLGKHPREKVIEWSKMVRNLIEG